MAEIDEQDAAYRERLRSEASPALLRAIEATESANVGSLPLEHSICAALGVPLVVGVSRQTDAALAFAEEMYPGVQLGMYSGWGIRTTEAYENRSWTHDENTMRGFYVRFFGDPEIGRNASAECATLPLAICGAILSARTAHHDYPHGGAVEVDAGRLRRASIVA